MSFVSRPDLRPPRILMDVDLPTQQPGLVVTDVHGGTAQQGPLLIDRNGELVWFHPVSDDGSAHRRALNVRVQNYLGQPVITYFEGAVVDAHGEGVYRLLDNRYRLIKTVEARRGMTGDLHELLLTEEGTALFTVYGTASGDLRPVGGPERGLYFYGEVQEVDVATGELLFSWRSDHHVGFDESYTRPSAKGVWDYFHINSINVDPDDGNLIVSSRCCWAFYKINRRSGAVIWRLGGKVSDFAVDAGARFAWQHDVTPLGRGVYTIFDNEGGPPGKPSRGLVIRADERARTASLVEQYLHEPPLYSIVLGSVQTLGAGHRFVGWGTTSYFTEYSGSGRPVLDAHLEGRGLESYRAFKLPWNAEPTERPALVAESHGDVTLAYVSWNGATGVARWGVSAGTSASGLHPVGVSDRMGFETVITIRGVYSHLQVEALDDAGRPLLASEVVTTEPGGR